MSLRSALDRDALGIPSGARGPEGLSMHRVWVGCALFVGLLTCTLFVGLLGTSSPRALTASLHPTDPPENKATPAQVQLDVVVAKVRGSRMSGMSFGQFSPRETHLFLKSLNAMKSFGLAKIIAEPRLVTLSGREARFLDGGQQAIPVPAGLGQVGIQFEELGTRLNMLPIVQTDGKIHLEAEVEVSKDDPEASTEINGTTVPGCTTARTRTTVELKPGETLLIGGLLAFRIEREEREKGGTIRTLTRLPVLGPYFEELLDGAATLVLITPTLDSPAPMDRAGSS